MLLSPTPLAGKPGTGTPAGGVVSSAGGAVKEMSGKTPLCEGVGDCSTKMGSPATSPVSPAILLTRITPAVPIEVMSAPKPDSANEKVRDEVHSETLPLRSLS